jgi:serine/threonine protein kinase
MPLTPGTKLGPYEIGAPLGAAPGVEAYQASDTLANRAVDLLFIPPEWADLSDFPARRQQFERTAQALTALNHPNVRAVDALATEDHVHYLVLEHLEGQTLAERIKRKPLALSEALEIGMAVASALEAAHAAGIVHRALTPASIMLTKGGVKLLDFGLAELRPPSIAAPGRRPLPSPASPPPLSSTTRPPCPTPLPSNSKAPPPIRAPTSSRSAPSSTR